MFLRVLKGSIFLIEVMILLFYLSYFVIYKFILKATIIVKTIIPVIFICSI